MTIKPNTLIRAAAGAAALHAASCQPARSTAPSMKDKSYIGAVEPKKHFVPRGRNEDGTLSAESYVLAGVGATLIAIFVIAAIFSNKK